MLTKISTTDLTPMYLQNSDFEKNLVPLVVTKSNRSAQQINNNIRTAKGHHSVLEVKDILISTENNSFYDTLNGDLFKVVEANEVRTVSKHLRGEMHPIELTFQEVVLERIDTRELISCEINLDHLKNEKPGLTIKQRQVLIVDYEQRKRDLGGDISKFFKDKYSNPALMRYGYCITCHRAQGSEADNVFVHVKNLSWMDRYADNKRWMYTACSRARKNLYIVEDKWI